MFNCMHCGLCLASCPTYREEGKEPWSPRGRLALIAQFLEGKLPPSPRLSFYIHSCLDCLACLPLCPSGIAVDEVISQAKTKLRESQPLPLLYRLLLHHLLPFPKRQERLFFFRRPLRPHLPGLLPAHGKRRYRVGFFLGCLPNILFPQIAQASLSLLQGLGCEVVIPRETRCCGKPLAAYGELDEAKRLARANLRAYQGLEAVVTDCATCGSFLMGYPRLLGDGSALPVKDISQFLLEIGPPEPKAERKLKVTYHDPCHLGRGMGIRQEPRRLLQLIPGLELAEMKESDSCCGGAGSYFLHYPQLSRRILERKLADIVETGAQAVATGCPACLLQLKRGLKGSGIQALHPVQLLLG